MTARDVKAILFTSVFAGSDFQLNTKLIDVYIRNIILLILHTGIALVSLFVEKETRLMFPRQWGGSRNV